MSEVRCEAKMYQNSNEKYILQNVLWFASNFIIGLIGRYLVKIYHSLKLIEKLLYFNDC